MCACCIGTLSVNKALQLCEFSNPFDTLQSLWPFLCCISFESNCIRTCLVSVARNTHLDGAQNCCGKLVKLKWEIWLAAVTHFSNVHRFRCRLLLHSICFLQCRPFLFLCFTCSLYRALVQTVIRYRRRILFIININYWRQTCRCVALPTPLPRSLC